MLNILVDTLIIGLLEPIVFLPTFPDGSRVTDDGSVRVDSEGNVRVVNI